MTQQLRVGDQVMFKGKQHKLTDIQIVYDRFQLSDTSGWLYGTSQIIKRYSEEYISELEYQSEAQRIRADKAEQEAKHQENRALRYSNDYHEACRFQLQYGSQAELAEQERDKLIQALKDIVAVPVAKSMHNEALILHNIAHKALEGSNTDAKRD